MLNRGGGAVAADEKIADKVREACAAAGIDAEIELIDGGDYEVRCRPIAERGDQLVIVGGGDGTISAAAAVLAGTETRLGILPLGTLNHFARDLEIPTDVAEAVRVIAAGKERSVDIGDMAFLLGVALIRELRGRGFFEAIAEPKVLDLLDLVALGTVADVARLKSLNRAFVTQGLRVMAARQNLGMVLLVLRRANRFR